MFLSVYANNKLFLLFQLKQPVTCCAVKLPSTLPRNRLKCHAAQGGRIILNLLKSSFSAAFAGWAMCNCIYSPLKDYALQLQPWQMLSISIILLLPRCTKGFYTCTTAVHKRVPFQIRTHEVATYQLVIVFSVSQMSWKDFVAEDKSYRKAGKVNKNEGKVAQILSSFIYFSVPED